MEKRKIRNEMKAQRTFNRDTHEARTREIADRFMNDRTFMSYPSYFVYKSTIDEVGTDSIICALLQCKKRVFAPRTGFNGVEAVEICEDTRFVPGAFGISEPTGRISDDEIAFAVVPMVAFDRSLNRLGHGKGLYDAFLKDFKGFKLGLAFEFQKVDAIDRESFDVPMDAILTEKALYRNESEGE